MKAEEDAIKAEEAKKQAALKQAEETKPKKSQRTFRMTQRLSSND